MSKTFGPVQNSFERIEGQGIAHDVFWQLLNFDFRNVESTDCAPNNGYYFLPLSPDDRGVFVLKGTNLV
jgi:hypothetical protein